MQDVEQCMLVVKHDFLERAKLLHCLVVILQVNLQKDVYFKVVMTIAIVSKQSI